MNAGQGVATRTVGSEHVVEIVLEVQKIKDDWNSGNDSLVHAACEPRGPGRAATRPTLAMEVSYWVDSKRKPRLATHGPAHPLTNRVSRPPQQ